LVDWHYLFSEILEQACTTNKAAAFTRSFSVHICFCIFGVKDTRPLGLRAYGHSMGTVVYREITYREERKEAFDSRMNLSFVVFARQ